MSILMKIAGSRIPSSSTITLLAAPNAEQNNMHHWFSLAAYGIVCYGVNIGLTNLYR